MFADSLLDKLVMLVVLVLFIVCGVVGYHMGSRRCSAERRMAQDAYSALESRYRVTSDKLAQLTQEQAKADHELQQQVDAVVRSSPVYRSDCFDDLGLRLANRALTPAPATVAR